MTIKFLVSDDLYSLLGYKVLHKLSLNDKRSDDFTKYYNIIWASFLLNVICYKN